MTAIDLITARYGVTSLDPPYPIALPGAKRADLPGLFAELGYTRGAEIGVWQGEYAEILCAGCPGLHLIAVDPWAAYDDYNDYKMKRSMRDAFDATLVRLGPYPHTILPQRSVDAAKHIDDESLDFVYIDGNHRFDYVVADLAAWTPKVKRGGIVAGHDYKNIPARKQDCRVVEAVTGWTTSYGIAPWFVLGRERTHHRDKHRSWLYVKA